MSPPLDLEEIKDKLAKLTETPYKSFPMVIFDDIRALLAECESLRAEVGLRNKRIVQTNGFLHEANKVLTEMAEAIKGSIRYCGADMCTFPKCPCHEEPKDALEKYEKWKGER